MINNDYQLSLRVRFIMDKFDEGLFSYEDAQNKITEAFKQRLVALNPAPSGDKMSLLSYLTEEGKNMRFSVDASEEVFSLEEIINGNDEGNLNIEDVCTLQNLCVLEPYQFGLGAEVVRVL